MAIRARSQNCYTIKTRPAAFHYARFQKILENSSKMLGAMAEESPQRQLELPLGVGVGVGQFQPRTDRHGSGTRWKSTLPKWSLHN